MGRLPGLYDDYDPPLSRCGKHYPTSWAKLVANIWPFKPEIVRGWLCCYKTGGGVIICPDIPYEVPLSIQEKNPCPAVFVFSKYRPDDRPPLRSLFEMVLDAMTED